MSDFDLNLARILTDTPSATLSGVQLGHVDLKLARVLIVDDKDANVAFLRTLLDKAGYTRLGVTTDSREVLRLVREMDPDIVLLDLHMPHADGFALMKEIRKSRHGTLPIPILVLTADVTPEAKRRALLAGAKDFLTKPFDSLEVLLRIQNLLETRFLCLELQRRNLGVEERLGTSARGPIPAASRKTS